MKFEVFQNLLFCHPFGYHHIMKIHYVIVLGTGLKECMLAGSLAKFPKKTEVEAQKEGANILQLDRNGYYGSDST